LKETFAIWLTGIPSSGKTTLARQIYKKLKELGIRVTILESDELRKYLTPDAKYTEEERDQFYRTLAVIGKYLVDNGTTVIFDATAPKRKYREFARKIIKNFIEVYVNCPLKICIERDVKGLYTKALGGEIKTLPGLQSKYEEPRNPDVIVNTDREDIEESTRKIITIIRERLNRL
jgi:adenylylsulfate kinase